MFLFDNPNKKPLNELTLKVKSDGVQKNIPALNSHWIKQRCHNKYISLNLKNNKIPNDANTEEWITETNWFNKELEWMLELECYEFWSYILYDNGCIECILSFLQESIPCYIPLHTITDNVNVINLYANVMKNILTIVCRLITNKESDIQYIDKKYLAEMLYTKYIISIPMLFDLLTTYGRSNINVLKKIFDTIFKIEPKYKIDLKFGMQFIQKTMNIIKQKSEAEKKLNVLNDLTLHALDFAYTLDLLLEVYPESRNICCDLKFERAIVEFYENTIPKLYQKIYNIDKESIGLNYLNYTRLELLASFKGILHMYIENILNDTKKSLVPAELYLNSLTEFVSEHIFIKDFNKLYPIENDLDVIRQACPVIDKFKIDFILQGISNENGNNSNEEINNLNENDIRSDNNENYVEEIPSTSTAQSECASRSIENEVKSILDILPHLGDGFIRKLLSRYETAESAISAVLEGNLPPDLAESDQSEVYIPPDPQDKIFLETGVNRLNIYDGDDYDVLTQDKPKGLIKRGKGMPGAPKTMRALLDDKSHVKEFKNYYEQYTMVTEDADEYDDEYDDSYDALAESETKIHAKLKDIKNVIVDEIDDDEDDDSDEPEEENPVSVKSKLDFCENPEIVRARYEQRRQNKMTGNKNFTSRNNDVVGKAKGQGQDDKVLANRHKKDVNKSSRANHNRKQGASWKRNRGMLPS